MLCPPATPPTTSQVQPPEAERGPVAGGVSGGPASPLGAPGDFAPGGAAPQAEGGPASGGGGARPGRPIGPRMPHHFWLGEFTTHFRNYFSGWIGMFTGG